MSAVLSQLSSTPGVVGSLLVDSKGGLLAHQFSVPVDPARLQQVAATLADRAAGLEGAVGTVGVLDLRFAGARIVVRPAAGGQLLMLCAPSVNMQTLALSASGAIRRLEQLGPAAGPAAEAAPPPAPSGALHRLLQQVEAAIAKDGRESFRLRGKIALMMGFALELIDPDTADDPAKLEKLRTAATTVLGKPF
jgi:predicted regulator of Ras-like GTPase activity (Roadblock/LC7/MglB family)